MMLSDGANQRSRELLASLSDQDRKTLIDLPVRVGLYVSYADISGGKKSQSKELLSLHGIIMEISQDYCKSEIMQKVLIETVALKDDWSRWDKNLETVPDECMRIIQALLPLVEQSGDLNSVRETMIDIAVAIAMAYKEDRLGLSFIDQAIESTEVFLNRFLPQNESRNERFYHPNISKAERKALQALVKAMAL